MIDIGDTTKEDSNHTTLPDIASPRWPRQRVCDSSLSGWYRKRAISDSVSALVVSLAGYQSVRVQRIGLLQRKTTVMRGEYSCYVDPRTLDSLASFCADQRRAFDARAWLGHAAVDARIMAVAAKFLSMTSWYGHEQELADICDQLHAGVATREWFDREVEAIGFDLSHFSATTRYRFALRQIEFGKT